MAWSDRLIVLQCGVVEFIFKIVDSFLEVLCAVTLVICSADVLDCIAKVEA